MSGGEIARIVNSLWTPSHVIPARVDPPVTATRLALLVENEHGTWVMTVEDPVDVTLDLDVVHDEIRTWASAKPILKTEDHRYTFGFTLGRPGATVFVRPTSG